VPIEAITTALIEALNAGVSFEQMIDRVSAWIKNFDAGPDLTEGTKFIVSQAD
jgi:hypothetical protein